MDDHEHVYDQDAGVMDLGRFWVYGCRCGAEVQIERKPGEMEHPLAKRSES